MEMATGIELAYCPRCVETIVFDSPAFTIHAWISFPKGRGSGMALRHIMAATQYRRTNHEAHQPCRAVSRVDFRECIVRLARARSNQDQTASHLPEIPD